MFKDYYYLLEIKQTATLEEIKLAYRKQCIKWHPDKNPDIDTTQRMQDINEAYLILKDEDARNKYNIEYAKFKFFIREKEFQGSEKEKHTYDSYKSDTSTATNGSNTQNSYSYSEYKFYDEILKKWMQNAKNQAGQMSRDIIDELRGATKEVGVSLGNYFIRIMIPMLIGYLFFKACQN